MKLLFIFLDGVGLGEDKPQVNPFIQAVTPHIDDLLDGNKIISNGHQHGSAVENIIFQNKRVSLLALDACLGVEGMPQSATGQASLLTGKNVPDMLGLHDGPKPNPVIMEILSLGTLFSQMVKQELKVSLLNAYPPRYFDSIESGYRLPGVIALSASYAGLPIKTMDDLQRGNAISTDFTAQGWRDHLGLIDTPLLTHHQAGERLIALSEGFELSFFEYWLTDVAGHHQDMQSACALLGQLDRVLGSLVKSWDDEQGLILITSDHGNLEDLSTRHHTRNDVPLLIVGSPRLRELFLNYLNLSTNSKPKPDLTDVTPAILQLIGNIESR